MSGHVINTATTTAVSGENRGPMINVVVWIIAFVSTAFLGLRMYCKLSRRINLWWDDHFLLASWVGLANDVIVRKQEPNELTLYYQGLSRRQQHDHERKRRFGLWKGEQHH